MKLKRYDLGREYLGAIGAPAITEQPDGRYVLHAEHEHEIKRLTLEIEIWRNRTIKTESAALAQEQQDDQA